MMERFMSRLLVTVLLAMGSISVCWCLVVDGDGSSTRLDALEYMLVEEKQLRAQLETKLEAKINNLQSSINVLDSSVNECGCSHGPHTDHPAFMATFLSSSGFDCSALQVAVFDDVKLNSGSAYNPTHGIFTAPVSGIYAFQVSLASPPQTSFHVAIVQNVTSNEIGYLFNQIMTQWTKRSTSTVTHLDAGEEVWMICLTDSHLPGHIAHAWHGAGDYHSHFSGFLIGAD